MIKLFGQKKESDDESSSAPVDIKWTRNPKGRYHSLMFLDTVAEGLQGKSGVYIIWHGGTKPTWLCVGATKDLAGILEAKIDDPEIETYYDRVGVYVSWSLVKPEYMNAIARYLTDLIDPEIKGEEIKLKGGEKPIAVFLPGQEPKQ